MASNPSQSTTTSEKLSGVQRIGLYVIMVMIPVVFFALLEGGLRLFGYGEDYPLFIEVPDQSDFLYQNPEVARRYFRQQSRVPTSQRDFFKAEKDADTFRIFVQGGSSAAGYPLYYGGSFSRMLEQRLLQTFPDRNIEVVNTALAAVNSYTLLDFADEIVNYEPDLILIYAGHNEYYGTLGVGSAEQLGQFRSVVNLFLRIQHFRIVQLLQNVIASSAGAFASEGPETLPGTTLMSRMVREQSIPFGSVLYKRGLAQFEGNLEQILTLYRENGIPVMIGTVGSNERDHAPFISEVREGADEAVWQGHLRAGIQAAQAGDTLQALSALDQAIVTDSSAANAYYAKGELLDVPGTYPQALSAYLAAKDRDLLRFRAPEAMNEVIRDVAGRQGASVVETQQALRDASRGGIIGNGLMLEHLHPNVEGYFIIADAFYEALREEEKIDAWDRFVSRSQARSEVLFTKVDSLVGQFRLEQLMASWPFQPAGTVAPSFELESEDPIEQIAFELYKARISWYQANTQLFSHYEAQQDYHEALRTALAAIQEYPFIPQGYLAAGQIMARQGRLQEALYYIEAGNERNESPAGMMLAGSVMLRMNRTEDGIVFLERAVQMQPTNTQAIWNLVLAYTSLTRYDEAEVYVRRLLVQQPNHQDAAALLERLVVERDRNATAGPAEGEG